MSEVGPNLSGIDARWDRRYTLESIVTPNPGSPKDSRSSTGFFRPSHLPRLFVVSLGTMPAIMTAWMVWHDVKSLDDPSPGRVTGAG